MSKLPFLPLYVADYLLDTTDLSPEQHGVYLLMLMLAWRRPDCALPNDMAWLKSALPQMHGLTFNRLIPPLLTRFFEVGDDGQFRNKRLTKERRKSQEISEKQKRKSEKRWSNREKSNTYEMPRQCHSQSQSQSHSDSQKENKEKGADAPSPYAFEGEVIKLSPKHLADWTAAFRNLDIESELQAHDAYLDSLPCDRGKIDWFIRTATHLRNRNAKVRAAESRTEPEFERAGGTVIEEIFDDDDMSPSACAQRERKAKERAYIEAQEALWSTDKQRGEEKDATDAD